MSTSFIIDALLGSWHVVPQLSSKDLDIQKVQSFEERNAWRGSKSLVTDGYAKDILTGFSPFWRSFANGADKFAKIQQCLWYSWLLSVSNTSPGIFHLRQKVADAENCYDLLSVEMLSMRSRLSIW